MMVDRERRNYWVDILQGVLQQQALPDFSAWRVKCKDESLSSIITELQERLMMTLPVRPDADMERQMIDINRHSIERAILLLRSDQELPREPWTVGNTWFPAGLLVGVSSLVLWRILDSDVMKWTTIIVLGAVIAFLWVASIGFHILYGWQIFQVRILRRDFTKTAIAADEADCWPFVSADAHQMELVASNEAAQNS